MKPLNLDNRPCSPISSNCVIWQGGDISCINLCSGDTVSDVVFKLATELCIIMDQLNVSNYDLSCLAINACPPVDFHALIQLLINKVCEANGIVADTTKASGCPDCVVSVAPAFVKDTQTTMQLVDYVQDVANKVSSILDQIDAINNELVVVNNTLVDLQYQINNFPVYTLPNIPADCILPAGTYPLDQVLDALMNDDILGYCSLLTATGTPAQIVSAVLSQCILDGDPSLASLAAGDSPVQSFSTYYAGSWVNNPSLTTTSTIANAIKNIWISICDIYSYVTSLGFIVADTNTVNLTYTAGLLTAAVQDTGWHDLEGFAYMSGFTSSKPQCRRIGNEIIFRGTIQIPMGNALDGAGGTVWPVNSPDEYNSLAYGKVLDVDTSASPDACLMYSSGVPPVPSTNPGVNKNEGISIYFRQGLRVIPSTVLPLAIDLDNSYTNGNRQFINRGISVNAGTNGVSLATHVAVAVTSTGQLQVTAPYAVENYIGTGLQDSSILRSVVSNIILGDSIPLYTNTAPSNSNFLAAGVDNVDITGSAITWPFTVNCINAYELGGFTVRIDGLKGYIDPCETLIATPPPC